MRKYIDIINEAESLEEKVFHKLEVKFRPVTVLKNPTRGEMLRYATVQNGSYFRGFLSPENDAYIFEAFNATHYDIGSAIGLNGKLFEIRSSKSTGEASMLYIKAQDFPDREEWRTIPSIVRLFGNDTFHIGQMRL